MLEIGSLLDGKYKILNEIGRGGMSVVYMALNEKANKTWAVKEIRKDGKVDHNTVTQGLVAEIETLKKLNHPNLPSVVDIIEDDDTFIIVMDYIEGNSLDKALEEYGAQPQEYVVEWAKQLTNVLGYLHSCNPPIIYRDMKPANIMLKPDGNVTLIDFGTAKTYDVNVGETTGIGTIGYAAPEQYIGSGLGRSDARTDIYCLGITLYHLLTGVDPCKHVISNKSVRAVDPSISPGLDEIILKCTQAKKEDRYQSCAELMYALEHHNEMGTKYRKKQKRKLFSFIATAILTVGLAITSVWANSQASQRLEENYNVQIDKAQSPELSEKEKLEYYSKALAIDATRKQIYLDIIDMLLLDNSNENLSNSQLGQSELDTTEVSFITKLTAGLDIKNGDSNETIQPLTELEKADREGYIEVCYTIGMKLWDYYDEDKETHHQAISWFDRVKSDKEPYAYAKYYSEIGKCLNNIANSKGNKRTDNLKELYTELLDKFNDLYQKSKNIENSSDTKRFIWREISNSIFENPEFVSYTDKNKLIELLDNIATDLKKAENDSNEIIREDINEIIAINDKALTKIDSAN